MVSLDYDQQGPQSGEFVSSDNSIIDLQQLLQSGSVIVQAIVDPDPVVPVGNATVPKIDNMTPWAGKILNNDNQIIDILNLFTSGAIKIQVDGGVAPKDLTYITQDDETDYLPNSLQLQGTENQIIVTNGALSLPNNLVLPQNMRVPSGNIGVGDNLIISENAITTSNGDLTIAPFANLNLYGNGDVTILSGVSGGSGDLSLIVNGTGTFGVQTGNGNITFNTDSGFYDFGVNSSSIMQITESGATVSANPVTALGVATKQYVDATVMPLQFGVAALVATSNITLFGVQTVDGVVTTTQVVLATNQTSAVNNGLWTANIAGAWTRAPAYTTWSAFYRLIVAISTGATEQGTSWACTVGPTGTVGTNNITFIRAAFQTYLNGNGLSLSDNVFSLIAPVSVANGGTGITSIGASGTFAQSNGSTYVFTTATYPSVATGSGKILRADGTNWVETTAQYPNTASALGNVITSDGTNFVSSAPAVSSVFGRATGAIVAASGDYNESQIDPSFNPVTTSTATLNPGQNYYDTYSGLCVMTLNATFPAGKKVCVRAGPTGATFKIAQNSGQLIRYGSQNGVSVVTTTGTSGYLQSVDPNTTVDIECMVANTEFIVVSNVNSLTVV